MSEQKKILDPWSEALKACHDCLDLNRQFALELEQKIQKESADPLDPKLWENFVQARQDLFDFTTHSLNYLSKIQKPDQQEIQDRLLESLTEMTELEAKLTSFLSENLTILKETIEELSQNQTLFSNYSRLTTKPEPDHLSSTA